MATEDLAVALGSGKLDDPSTDSQSQLIRGAPVVKKLLAWCSKHNKAHHGVKPTLAVVYFDTGDDANEYLFVKRLVAAKVSRTPAGWPCALTALIFH